MLRNYENMIMRLNEFSLLTKKEIQQTEEFFLWAEINLINKTDYIKYIKAFNDITGKKYKPSIKSRTEFYKHSYIHSLEDRVKALKNCLKDNWIKENFTIVTPEWALKSETVAKYINYTQVKKITDTENKQNFNKKNYNESGI